MEKFKIYKLFGILLIIISTISVGFTIYSMSLLNNIETFYRIMGCVLLVLFLVTLVYSLIDSIKSGKTKKFVISSILTLLLAAISFVIAFAVYKVYKSLDNMTSEEVSYKTVLLALEDKGKIEDLKDLKIGLVENEEDITGYILPIELIEKYKLEDDNEIVKVSDTVTLMSMLLNKEVDAIFISANYKGMFKNVEEYDEEKTSFVEITSYSKNYQKKETEKEKISTNTKITEPFTVLILGIDSAWDYLDPNDSFNGDTIMLLAVDPETFHVTMFSIPRDTYVKMACGGNITKINAAAWGGTRCMVKTVENLTGIDVNYYVTINFKGVVDLVDALGGITIDVPMTFCETNSNREGEICLNEGVQTLSGEQALAVARHRYTLPLGDFQRGQNQQVVVEGMLNSVKNLRSVTDFYTVLNTVSRNIDTNMSTDEMLSLYNVVKNVLLKTGSIKPNITKTFLTGYSLMEWAGYGYTYTFQYYKQSLAEIVNALKVNLRLATKPEIKSFSFSINKPYEREIIGYEYYSEAKKELMPDLLPMGLEGAKAWASSHGFNVTVEKMYYENRPDLENGQLVEQSIHEGILLEKTPSNLILYIAEVDNSKLDTPKDTERPLDKENENNDDNKENNNSENSNGEGENGGESSSEGEGGNEE